MIPNFSVIIQHDILAVVNRIRGKDVPADANLMNDTRSIQNAKVAFAAVRIFATAGMVTGGVLGVTATLMLLSSPISALFLLAVGVGTYAVNHDVFVMAKNMTDQANRFLRAENPVLAFIVHIKGLFDEIVDLNDKPLNPITKDAYFSIIWNDVLKGMMS